MLCGQSLDYPRTILKNISEGEKRPTYSNTAFFWFCGEDLQSIFSKSIIKKHRDVLLKYGIDILSKPQVLLKDIEIKGDEESWFKLKTQVLKVVK